MRTGDIIRIDIPNRSINVELTENELDARRAEELKHKFGVILEQCTLALSG